MAQDPHLPRLSFRHTGLFVFLRIRWQSALPLCLPPTLFPLSGKNCLKTQLVIVLSLSHVCSHVMSCHVMSAVMSAAPWTAAHQACLSFTISQSLLKLMPVELVMPSNHLIFGHPFSPCPQYLQPSGSFLMSHLFTSDGQNIRASASASILQEVFKTDFL